MALTCRFLGPNHPTVEQGSGSPEETTPLGVARLDRNWHSGTAGSRVTQEESEQGLYGQVDREVGHQD